MTTSTTKNKKAWQMAAKAAAVLFWLAVWQSVYMATAQEVLLVSPGQAVMRLLELSVQLTFWRSVGASCYRVLLGFLAGLATGTLLGIATGKSKVMHWLFEPPLRTIRATPVASFIILALVWIAVGRLPVFIAFLMVVPMVWANVHAGMSSVDVRILEMARLFRFSTLKKVKYVYLPAVMPYFVAAFTTGIGFAWKSGIAAEVIAQPRMSIGKQIYNAKIYLETRDLFAWTIAVILLSVFMEKLAVLLLRGVQQRYGRGGHGDG